MSHEISDPVAFRAVGHYEHYVLRNVSEVLIVPSAVGRRRQIAQSDADEANEDKATADEY